MRFPRAAWGLREGNSGRRQGLSILQGSAIGRASPWGGRVPPSHPCITPAPDCGAGADRTSFCSVLVLTPARRRQQAER